MLKLFKSFKSINATLFFICKLIIGGLIILTIYGFLKPHISNLNQFHYLQFITSFEMDLNQFVKNIIPTEIAHQDYSRFLTMVCLVLIFWVIMGIYRVLDDLLKQKINALEQKGLEKIFEPDNIVTKVHRGELENKKKDD